MTRAIGQRQAGALTLLWVLAPNSVPGAVLGMVLNPGESSAHARRSLARLTLRGLISSPAARTPNFNALRAPYRITNEGVAALRQYALGRGALTVEVLK